MARPRHGSKSPPVDESPDFDDDALPTMWLAVSAAAAVAAAALPSGAAAPRLPVVAGAGPVEAGGGEVAPALAPPPAPARLTAAAAIWTDEASRPR